MAVIQISKIQVRRGAIGDQGMPQLASGEMGWAVDTQQLFIGNGSVAEGAPAVGNTEILTVSSTASTNNLFTQFLGNDIYVYNKGYPQTQPVIQTGTGTNFPTVRTVQQKLDEIVNVTDFGAKGDGVTDDSAAIQRAVTSTYMTSYTDFSFRKILHFPAGTYVVSATIYIPPNTYLQGEGIDRSLLVNTNQTQPIIRTRHPDTVHHGAFLPITTGTTNDTTIQNIKIENLGFTYGNNVQIHVGTTNTVALLLLDQTEDSIVTNCKFYGVYTNAYPTTNDITNGGTVAPTEYAGINAVGPNTRNLIIENNIFKNLIQGYTTYQDNRYVIFNKNQFDTLYYGINSSVTGGNPVVSLTGALYNRASDNIFKNIYSHGIRVQTPPIAGLSTLTAFTSEGNVFSNVGNGNGTEASQQYECISFNSSTGCVSINDKFERFNLAQTIYSGATFKPLVTGQAISIDDKTAYRYPLTFTSNVTTSTLIRVPYLNTLTTVVMEYQMEKSSGFRKGVFTVSAPPFGLGAITYKDDYNYSGTDPGVVLTAKLISSTGSVATADCIAVQYENDTHVGAVGDGTISLTLKYQT